jgi:hypothetical protein
MILFKLGAEAEEFVHAHLGVERDVFRHVADAFAHLDRISDDIVTGDADAAVGRRQVAGEDFHRRALAGAVGPEKADDLALVHMEVDSLHGTESRIRLRQVLDFDHKTEWGKGKDSRHSKRK